MPPKGLDRFINQGHDMHLIWSCILTSVWHMYTRLSSPAPPTDGGKECVGTQRVYLRQKSGCEGGGTTLVCEVTRGLRFSLNPRNLTSKGNLMSWEYREGSRAM